MTTDSKEKDSQKQLLWTDSSGNTYRYLKNPMFQACMFILTQEMCERLAFYGLTPNLQGYLQGENGATRLVNSTADANSLLQMWQGVMFATPVISAILADTVFGVYNTILIFSVFYIIGLALMCASTLADGSWMVYVGLMVFMSLGAGGIKSCVNVFGAHQFHPEHHKESMTTFFTYFYASINIGGLIGGVACPIVQENVSWFAGFMIPTCAFVVATAVFVAGCKRYVYMKPQGSVVLRIGHALFKALTRMSFEKCKISQGGEFEDNFIEDAKAILRLAPLFLLIIPFLIVYGQMTTTFLTQGKKMDRDVFGWSMPAALMQNVDCIAVILTALWADGVLFPALRKRNIMPTVLGRFAIGSLLGAIAVTCGLIVEYVVMGQEPDSVSIFWQVPQYALVAAGEVFLISTSYEMAFSHSPDSLKAFASALNLLFFALANFLSGFLSKWCSAWLTDYTPDGTYDVRKQQIKDSQYHYYYYLLIGLSIVGAVASLACNPYYKRVKEISDQRKAEFEAEKQRKIAAEQK